MKYNEMYPDTEVGVEPVPGLRRIEDEVPCVNCGEICSWHCTHIDKPSCSMDCHHALTQVWLREQRYKWIEESLITLENEGYAEEPWPDNPKTLLRQQHNKTIARLVEWAKSEQLAFFYIDVPRTYPFEGEIPVVPIKGIQWTEVTAMVSALIEEPVTAEAVKEPTEEPVQVVSLSAEPVDPMGDETYVAEESDDEVWMGNDPPYLEESNEPHKPIDLQAFAANLEADEENSDESDN